MITESIKAKGSLTLVLKDEHGNVKQQDEVNLVVDTGLAYIASRMKDTTLAAMSHMAIGTSDVDPAAGQTTLLNEVARVALDSTSLVTTTATNDSIQYVATFGAGTGTGGIKEAGLFNDTSAGTMLCRTEFAVINKGAADTLAITWKVTIA